jgi:hypothetical protein
MEVQKGGFVKTLTSPRDYNKQAEKKIAEQWFPNHKATIETCPNGVTTIEWKKPGTGIFGVRYVLWGGTLYVSGDIGEAVYCWSSEISIQFLASCNLDYFLGKCQASETGRSFVEWDDDVARYKLDDMLKDEAECEGVSVESTELFKILEGVSDKEGCESAAREAYDGDGDSERASMIHDAGEVPNMRAIAHWKGLRMIQETVSKVIL